MVVTAGAADADADVDVDAFFLSLGDTLPRERPPGARGLGRHGGDDDGADGGGWAPTWTSPSPTPPPPRAARQRERTKARGADRKRPSPRPSSGAWSAGARSDGKNHGEDQETLSVDVTRDLLESARRLAGSSSLSTSSPSSSSSSTSGPASPGFRRWNDEMRAATASTTASMSGASSLLQQRQDLDHKRRQQRQLHGTLREQAAELETLRDKLAEMESDVRAARRSAEEEAVGAKSLRRALEGLEAQLKQERSVRKVAETKLRDAAMSGSNTFEETRRKLHEAQHARDVAIEEARRANKMRDAMRAQTAETCAELRARVQHLEKENARASERIVRSEAALAESAAQRGELATARQKHIEELSAELEEALARGRRLAAEKDKAESQVLQVEGAVARAQLFSERLEEAETEIDDLRGALFSAQKAERDLLTRCGALEAKLQSSENQRAEAETRAIQAETQLDAIVSERSSRAADRVELERIREDLAATQTSVQSLSEKNESLSQKLETAEAGARRHETSARDAQRALQVVQVRLSQACSGSSTPGRDDEGESLLRTSGLDKSEIVATLQPVLETVRALEKVHADAKSRLGVAEAEVGSVRAKEQSAAGRVADLEKRVRELDTELAQVRDRLFNAQTRAKEQAGELQEAHHCIVAMEGELHRERDTHQREAHAVRRRLLRAQLDCMTSSSLVRPARDLAAYDVESNLEDLADVVGRLLDQKVQSAETLAARVKDLEARAFELARDRPRIATTPSRPRMASSPGSDQSDAAAAAEPNASAPQPDAGRQVAAATARVEALCRALALAMTCLGSALRRIEQMRHAQRICSRSVEDEVQNLHAWAERLFGSLLRGDAAPNPFGRRQLVAGSCNSKSNSSDAGRRIRFATLARAVVELVRLGRRCRAPGTHESDKGSRREVLRGLGLGCGEEDWCGESRRLDQDDSSLSAMVAARSARDLWTVVQRKYAISAPEPSQQQKCCVGACRAEKEAFGVLRHALMYYENELGRELESWRGKEAAREDARTRVPRVADRDDRDSAESGGRAKPASGTVALERLRQEQMEAQAELERALAQLDTQMERAS